jgi:hypothetical protein
MIAKERDALKLILKEARVLHRQYSQWRETDIERVCIVLLHPQAPGLKNIRDFYRGKNG